MHVGPPRVEGQDVSPADLPRNAGLVIASLDARALGIAVGTACAAVLIVCTLILVNRGGPVVGPRLGLLSHYLLGYSVTVPGALIGGAYAFGLGFGFAYAFARLRDGLIRLSLRLAWNRAQRRASRDLLDHLT